MLTKIEILRSTCTVKNFDLKFSFILLYINIVTILKLSKIIHIDYYQEIKPLSELGYFSINFYKPFNKIDNKNRR